MARAVIHLDAIKHNLDTLRSLAPMSKVLAIVKANAYGHGDVQVAQQLSQWVDGFGVARIGEARRLREALPTMPIVIMSEAAERSTLYDCQQHNFGLFVHTIEGVDNVAKWHAQYGANFDIWLKVDTGMHRLGIALDELETAVKRLQQNEKPATLRVLTHLANADIDAADSYRGQLQRFRTLNINQYETSIANTAAILRAPESHADWIRPGIGLYGANPLKYLQVNGAAIDLAATMTFSAPVISIRKIAAGEAVGYGSLWQTPRQTYIGTIAAGYADGYPRHASNGTPVAINGLRYPLVGRVSMDMISVDLGPDHTVQLGDEAELWGQTIDVSEVAKLAQTIAYDLFCGIGSRVQRQWLD